MYIYKFKVKMFAFNNLLELKLWDLGVKRVKNG